MAKVNKISSFKSFTEIKKQESVSKLREENNSKRQDSVGKIAAILDELGLTSFEGLEEDQKQAIISKIFGDVSEEEIAEIEVEVEDVTESVKCSNKKGHLWKEIDKDGTVECEYCGLRNSLSESVITEAKKITKAAIEEIGDFRDGEGYSSNEYYILADWAQDELGDGPYDIKKLEKLLKSKEVQKDMEGNNAVDVEYLEEFSESVVTEAKYNKKSLLKKLGKADDATIQTGNGKEYVIYNPDSNNDDNAAMWNDNSVFAVDQDGEEHEIDYKDIGLVLVESNVNEAEVSSAEDFREYATAVLQNAFEEDYDETKAEEVISGLISKHGEDYGAMIGALQSSLA